MSYRCLVCGYDQMPREPRGYNICPCCGVEYGVDDAFESYGELRDEWLLAGGPWFSNIDPFLPPAKWDAWDQLGRAAYSYNVPRRQPEIRIDCNEVRIPQGVELVRALRQRPEWQEA